MKKLFSFFLALIASTGTMFAEGGMCGENLTWDLTGSVLTISGTGAMADYNGESSEEVPWYSYQLSITEVSIENSVTSIGNYAFSYCSNLTSIEIPNSVTSIGEYAFWACFNLTNVTIPNSVTSIGNDAFDGCALTSLTIPNSVTNIGNDAFSYCTNLTSITIPNSVTSIGYSAFSGCSGLTSIIVEKGNTKYDSRNDCNAIIETGTNILVSGCKNTIIPNSVTSIGYEAFYGCSGLTSIEIPNSVTSIGNDAFLDCSGLTSVTIPNSVTSIGHEAFRYCSNLMSIEIPNSVTSIGYSAFSDCPGLTSVVIPNSVTSIGSSAFSNCKGLTSIEIPNSVTSIGSSAFSDCSGLTSIEIPNSVTSIGSSAFYGCSGLTSIANYAVTPQNIYSNVFYNVDKSSCKLYVPYSSIDAYQSADGWKEFTNILPIPSTGPCIIASGTCGAQGDNLTWELSCDSVLTIDGNGKMDNFYSYGSAPWYQYRNIIKMVQTNEGITSIGNYAFWGLNQAKSIQLASTIDTIGRNSVEDCFSLTSLIVPQGVKLIGYDAFHIGSSLLAVEWCATQCYFDKISSGRLLSDCSSLQTISIASNVQSLPNYMFDYISNLTINSYAIIPPAATTQTFERVDKSASVVYVPAGSVEAYKSADGWKEFTNIQAISSADKHTISITATNGHVEGSGEYDAGTSVTLTAVPDEGYVFDHWSDGNIDNPRTIVLTQDTAFTAEFALYVNEEESYLENNPTIASAEQDFDIVGTSYTIPGLFNAGHGGIQSGDMPDKGVKFRISRASTVDALKENAIDFKVNFGYVINSITLIGVTNTADVAAAISGVFVDGIKYMGTFDNTLPAKGGGTSSNVVIAGINAKSSIIFTFNRGTVTQANICYKISYTIDTNPVVRFLDWNGNMLSEQIVETGQSAIAPSSPSREGYTFIGWDKDFSNITEDLVVTAQYKINRFYVQFLDWDNTILKADSVDWNTTAIAPANPSREGYDFLGWDKEFGSVTSDLVVNAQYEYGRTTNYSMTFVNGQNSEEIFDEIVTIKVPAVPAITGFTFLKWEIVSGDLADGFVIQAVYTANTPTEAPAVYTNPTNPAQKLIRNGNVYILTDDKTYTVTGQEVR